MDPGTDIVVHVTSKVIEKLVGPTVDQWGENFRSWLEKGGLTRVFRSAVKKLGNSIDSPGTVPARVLKGVIDAGQFCDDELAADYLGGVLASSRTPMGIDDRGLTFLALTSQLSSFQIRLHYLCYTFWHHRFHKNWLRHSFGEDNDKMTIAVTWEFILQNMPLYEPQRSESIYLHSVMGLQRLGLLDNLVEGLTLDLNNFANKKGWKLPDDTLFIVRPTTFGGEYYIWGTGNGTALITEQHVTLPDDLPGVNAVPLRSKPTLLNLKR